jgi:hypothetical protein
MIPRFDDRDVDWTDYDQLMAAGRRNGIPLLVEGGGVTESRYITSLTTTTPAVATAPEVPERKRRRAA